MRRFIEELRDFPKKGDWVLLILCLVTSGYGGIMVASATNAAKFGSNTKYILIQLVATALGVMIYAIVSSIDVDFMSEHRTALVIFNVCLLLLLIPFGDDHSTGNKSWLTIPLVPVSIQPAEIARIAYIIIMASVMASHQNDISSIPSVLHMVFHLGLVTGLNMVLSGDAGVSLVFVFDFVSIHPFNDGNGRMSRLLTLLLLYRCGYTVGKYVSIEKEIERSKETYYEALGASSAGWQDGENDYTPFVTYMLGVMTACYKELDRRFAIAAGPKSGEGMLRAYFEQLVGAATKRDIMDANPSISKRTVERVLKKLQDDGTIEKTGSARSTAYRKR